MANESVVLADCCSWLWGWDCSSSMTSQHKPMQVCAEKATNWGKGSVFMERDGFYTMYYGMRKGEHAEVAF